MSNVKNYGLTGIGQTVQLGKGGSTLSTEAEKIAARNLQGGLTQMQAADPVADHDVVTKQYLQTFQAGDGMSIPLGSPTDASLTDGAIVFTGSTTVTNAVDQLNELMGKLIPQKPLDFPGNQSLSILSTQSGLLAVGVPDNTVGGALPAIAGGAVSRTANALFGTNTIGASAPTGPGNEGILSGLINTTVVDTIAFSSAGETKNTGVLRVSSNADFPSITPGFWKAIQTNLTNASSLNGWNRAKITHTVGTTNDAYFVYDPMTAVPVVINGTTVENNAGTLAYSSGVPHYATGIMQLNFTSQHLAGETYKAGNILQVSTTNGIGGSISWAPGSNGLPSILPRNMPDFDTTNYLFDLSANGALVNKHGKGQTVVTATNMNGIGNSTFGPQLLVKRGTTNLVDEMSIPVSIVANGGPANNGSRIIMDAGAYPNNDKSGLSTGDWVSSSTPALHESAVVAGILGYDKINYTVGYLPVGPDRTNYDNTIQYFTFMFRRTAVSKFDIAINGTFASLNVKLVGVSESTTASENGWYSMAIPYSGAGYPGNTGGGNGSLGCALGTIASGNPGSYTCTFGTKSTTAATNNIVLVRIGMVSGNAISGLSITPATR
jgi:hypothetical protein